MIAESLVDAIRAEAASAEDRYGSYHSTHEAFGVLAEEVAELLDAIRANDPAAIHAEAIQVSAVAMRLASQTHRIDGDFAERSGFAG